MQDSKDDLAWLVQAERKYMKGRHEEAIRDCDEAIKLNPKNDSALKIRGDAKLLLNRKKEALQDYEEIKKLNPQDSSNLLRVAKLKRGLGYEAEAISDFNEAIRLMPDNYQRGLVQESLRRYEEAIADYSQALKSNPTDSILWDKRAGCKERLHRYEEAIADYDEAIKIEGGTRENLWAARTKAKRLQGRYEEVIKDCDEYIKENASKQSENFYPMIWRERGEANLALGNYEKAIKDFNQAIRQWIDLEESPPGEYLELRGMAKRKLNRYEEAIKDFDEAIKIGPAKQDFDEAIKASVVAFQERGTCLRRLSRYEEAIRDFTESLRIDPKSSFSWKERGAAKVGLGKYQEALMDFDEAVKLNPRDLFTLLNRGQTYKFLELYEEAAADLSEAVKLNPTNNSAKQGLEEVKKFLDLKRGSHSDVATHAVFNQSINASMTIPSAQLSFEHRLGEGSFGEVHKGIWSPTSLAKFPIAIKQLKNAVMTQKSLEDFKREVEIQIKLDSCGIVKLYGITAEQPYCMVMEFMEQGSLRDVLDSHKPEELQWKLRLQIALNMSKGLAYLHQQKPLIIHGDIKSLNIFLNDKWEAKLGDFGLAVLKTESRSREYVSGNADKNKGPKGSLLWVAPELFRMNAKRTPATDIFSLAVVFWELASHLFPYESAYGDSHRIQDWVEKGERESFDERTPNTPKEYINLTQRCWDAKPDNRPSAEKVVSELEKLYASTPLAPTMFSSGSNTTSNPVKKPSVNSGAYLVKFAVPSASSSQVPPKGSYMGNVYK